MTRRSWTDGGGDVVVYGGDVALGMAERAVGEAEAFEGLRAGDFVDQLEVDVEDGGLAGGFGDDVLLPDFFEESAGLVHFVAPVLVVEGGGG